MMGNLKYREIRFENGTHNRTRILCINPYDIVLKEICVIRGHGEDKKGTMLVNSECLVVLGYVGDNKMIQ